MSESYTVFMKRLEKVIILGSLLFATVASTASAAFISRQKAYLNARSVVGGTKTVSFALSVRDVNSPDIVSVETHTITWAPVDPGSLNPSNSWRIADQVIRIESIITDLSGGIQFVTENTSLSAIPRFRDDTPEISSNTDSNPAGLIIATRPQGSMTLPVAWTIKESTRSIGSVDPKNGLQAADPNSGPETGSGNRFQWLYIIDKNTPAIDLNGSGILGDENVFGKDSEAFVEGQEYSRIIDDRGIHYGQANADGSPAFGGGTGKKVSYLYLECNFANALPQTPYRSGRLLIEAFNE